MQRSPPFLAGSDFGTKCLSSYFFVFRDDNYLFPRDISTFYKCHHRRVDGMWGVFSEEALLVSQSMAIDIDMACFRLKGLSIDSKAAGKCLKTRPQFSNCDRKSWEEQCDLQSRFRMGSEAMPRQTYPPARCERDSVANLGSATP